MEFKRSGRISARADALFGIYLVEFEHVGDPDALVIHPQSQIYLAEFEL